MRDGPLRVGKSLSIMASPTQSFRPVFDCLGLSNWLKAEIANQSSSFLHISGIGVRNGVGEEGGAISIRAVGVEIRDVQFRDVSARAPAASCALQVPFLSGNPSCLRGGGAIFVEADTVVIDSVHVINATSTRSGGAIAVTDARQVAVTNVVSRMTEAKVFGGCISVGSTSSATRDASWIVADADITTSSSAHGGALSFFANALISSRWSVTDVRVTVIRAAAHGIVLGGAISALVVGDVTDQTSWAFTGIHAMHTHATTHGDGSQAHGGVISAYAYNDVTNGSAWTFANITARNTSATVSGVQGLAFGGAISAFANHDVSNRSFWTFSNISTAHAAAAVDGDHGGARGGAISAYALHDVNRSSWTFSNISAIR